MIASGSVGTFCSKTTLPASSTTHTDVSFTDTSRPTKCAISIAPSSMREVAPTSIHSSSQKGMRTHPQNVSRSRRDTPSDRRTAAARAAEAVGRVCPTPDLRGSPRDRPSRVDSRRSSGDPLSGGDPVADGGLAASLALGGAATSRVSSVFKHPLTPFTYDFNQLSKIAG